MDDLEYAFHTDDAAIQDACRKYWQRSTDGKFPIGVAAIAKLVDIHASGVAAFAAEHCTAYDPTECCPRCQSWKPFTSRADYLRRRSYRMNDNGVCPACRESERIAAEEERSSRTRKTFQDIQAVLDAKRRDGLLPESLSFRDAIYLVALLRAFGSEDLSFIKPLAATSSSPLSPSSELDLEIVRGLFKRGLICVHPGSHPESVVVTDGEFREFYLNKVHWVLPLPVGGLSPAAFLEKTEAYLRSDKWSEHWHADAGCLHREIALAECLQYLQVVMEEHGFPPPTGEKIRLVLRSVLRDFSIGQSYNFIWRAAKDAASFYLREQTVKTHASNIVPGAIQRMSERALAAKWDTTTFRRDFRAPLSVISHVLFTMTLQLPDDGFTTVPPPEESAVDDAE